MKRRDAARVPSSFLSRVLRGEVKSMLSLDLGEIRHRAGGLADFVEQLEAVFAQRLSSTLTVTLSKKASTKGRSLAIARHGAGEVFLGDGGGGFFLGRRRWPRPAPSLRLLVELGIRRAGVLVLSFFSSMRMMLVARLSRRAGSCRRRCRGICRAPRRGGRSAADRPGRSSANTASTRSCRAPCSRNCTFRRSAKKESRSRVWLR